MTNPQVQQLDALRVARFNQKHPPYETLKSFELLAREFTATAGELTPTLKLKRKKIEKMYKGNLEKLYLVNDKV